jgi:hypothetical protein
MLQLRHRFAENLPNYGYVLLSESEIRTADLLIRSQTLSLFSDLFEEELITPNSFPSSFD